MIETLKILAHHGMQYIPDVKAVNLPTPYRGRPVISDAKIDENKLANMCPLKAIGKNPFSIDLGKCSFCGECAFKCPEKIKFTQDYKLSTSHREDLIIKAGENKLLKVNPKYVRDEIKKVFGRSLKLRQISAGGDNSAELELNASSNANFDMGRFGIEFVASPRHADGIVITGPISENMAEAVKICYDAVPDPKIVVLCGTDAISGGLFENSPAVDRTFLDSIKVDLFICGNPPHPLTFVNGILQLIGK
jgi:Ni,Fe-hydrogenase III small subunit/NAD-dependent dihydropyrimidine dehydrogenase PreA subunit